MNFDSLSLDKPDTLGLNTREQEMILMLVRYSKKQENLGVMCTINLHDDHAEHFGTEQYSQETAGSFV